MGGGPVPSLWGWGLKNHRHPGSMFSYLQAHRSESLEFPVGSCMQGPLASELGLGVQRDEPWSQAVQAEKNLLVSSGQ